MFCYKCGKQVPDESMFCPNCGMNLTAVNPSPEMPQSLPCTHVDSAPTDTLPTVSTTPPVPEDTHTDPVIPAKPAVLNRGTMCDSSTLRPLLGWHADYYLNEFKNIDQGGVGHFNWIVLFFSPIVLLYRRQFAYFENKLLPAIITRELAGVLVSYAESSFGSMGIFLSNLLNLGALAYLIYTIVKCAREFNTYYRENMYSIVDGRNLLQLGEILQKQITPSAAIPIACIMGYWLIIEIINAFIALS